MSELRDIVKVSISRETQSISRAGFGIPAIIAEFLTAKTTPAFDRFRYYGSITEMNDEGWGTSDAVYNAANVIFSQNPRVDQVMVGRKDSGDADWTEALNEVETATQNWYTYSIVASAAGTVVFDIDFVESNSIVFTINGVAVTAVPFNATQADTMDDIKTQIETDITDSAVTIDDVRTLTIQLFGDQGIESVDVVTTGGISQPVAAVTYVNEDDYKEAAAWTETQKKIYFLASSSALILDGVSTSDIAYYMQNLSYDRTSVIYHPSSQGDAIPSWIETGWPGETLPRDPGSQTWAYKTIAGVPGYTLKSGERTGALGKNANIYTITAGVNITEEGKVASGEYLDIIRGIDDLEAAIQEAIFTDLLNNDKIPFTDDGIIAIENTLKGILAQKATQGLLVAESIVVTVPLAKDVPTADKLARNLPDVKFTAILQGAIHSVEIDGVVTI